jgi:hypothetical protein
VKIRLRLRDEAVMREVKSNMTDMHALSIEWMEMLHAEMELDSQLSRWRLGELRLTGDRTEAEMRVHCSDFAACELLR